MSAPLTLFAIEQAFILLDHALAAAEENGTGDADEINQAWFNQLVGDLAVKAANVVGFGRMQERLAAGFDGMALAAEAEAKRLKALAATRRARAERLERLLLRTMKAAQCSRLETAVGTVCVQRNGGKRVIEWTSQPDPLDVAELHPDLVVVETTFNNDAVRDALVAGRVLPFARLREQGEHIRIR